MVIAGERDTPRSADAATILTLFAEIRGEVQGLQVSAPFGKIPFALRVFEDVESVSPAPQAAPAVGSVTSGG